MSAPVPFKTQEELVEFVGKARTAFDQIEAAGDVNARIKAIEQMGAEFRLGLDAMKAHQAEQSQIGVSGGGDADVVRSYYNPAANRDELDGVADLRRGERADIDRGVPYAGSSEGVVRLFGASDDCGVFEYGLLDDPNPRSEWQLGLQQRYQAYQMIKAIKGPRWSSRKMQRGIRKHLAKGPAQISRVFADNPGEGGEFIVTIPLTQLERTAEMMRLLESAFPTMNVSGGNTFTYPFLNQSVQPFVHGVPDPGDNNPAELIKTVPSTSERTVTTKTFYVNVPVDMDAQEDSIIDSMGIIYDLIARALTDGFEDALINGDAAATHGDTAFATWNPRGRWTILGSGSDHRRAFTGLRQQAFDRSAATDRSAAQGPANYLAQLNALSQPHGLGDVFGLTSPEHLIAKILTDSNVLTVDKYGPAATLLTGEVARIANRPLLLSEFVTADLASSGLYTGLGSTTSFLWVCRPRYKVVRRRNYRVNVENYYTRNTSFVVASERKSFHTMDVTSVKNVALAYNVAAS